MERKLENVVDPGKSKGVRGTPLNQLGLLKII